MPLHMYMYIATSLVPRLGYKANIATSSATVLGCEQHAVTSGKLPDHQQIILED